MARPIKNNADYFYHDANMRNQRKILAVRRKYFAQGYGVWCMLQEVLADSDFFTIKLDEIEIELLASDFMVEADLLEEIFQYLDKLDLVSYDVETGVLSCPSLTNSLQPLVEKRKRDKQRKQSKNKVSDSEKHIPAIENQVPKGENEVFAAENSQYSKAKQSIVKESKVKNSNNSKVKQGSISVDDVDFMDFFTAYSSELSEWEFRGAFTHFKKQVSRNGNTNYDSQTAVVTHFRNWFNAAVSSSLIKEVLAKWGEQRVKLLKNFNKVTRVVLSARNKKYSDLEKLRSSVGNARALFDSISVDFSVLQDSEFQDFGSAWEDCEKFFNLFEKSSDDLLKGFLKQSNPINGDKAKVTSMTSHLANKLKVS